MNKKIEKYGVANLFPDSNPPEISFHKRFAADVDFGNDSFTFTPKFGDFKEFDDVFVYLTKYIEDNKLEKLHVEIDWLRTCIYEIDPETLEIGEFVKSEGSVFEIYEWNNKTKDFDEVDEEEEKDDE